MSIKRAIVSVTDKTGVAEFAKGLERLGVEILSTGGTAKVLKENGVKVTPVEEYTGFPEIMGGRVKTLHPKIHGGILCLRDNDSHVREMEENGIKPIDMLVINLYQFEKTVSDPDVSMEEAIENIDIGGPSMLRAAAKNYRHVVVVTDPEDYDSVLEALESKGDVKPEMRELFALKAFRMSADYDSRIDEFLSKRFAGEDVVRMKFVKGKKLRYGENWHQKAKVFTNEIPGSLVNARQLHGKEMSFNNYVDADASVQAAMDLKHETAAAIIKHTNPCGYATGKTLRQALERAWEGDPVSAFGSVIAVTKPFGRKSAEFLEGKFVEVIIAPEFEEDALEILKEKKNLRLLELPDFNPGKKEYRFISGGILEQDKDIGYVEKKGMNSVTVKEFPEGKKDLAIFACFACKHTKSNSIILAREYEKGYYQVIGMGAGQPNRVDSLRKIAVPKALENFREMGLDENEISNCVMASDSFFPFADSIEEAAKHGIKYIVQPGGSIRDKEVIEACDRLGIAMAFTGRRMFKH